MSITDNFPDLPPARRTRAEPTPVASEMEEVTIDLPPHAPDIRIDGRIYQPGMTYEVKSEQAATLRDIMYRAWAHEQEVRGQRTGFAPKPRNYNLRG